jgi:hypothetical protein
MERLEIVHAPTIENALEYIAAPWDVILMDYALDKPVEYMDHKIRDGCDLVMVRRIYEDGHSEDGRAFIIGTCSNQVGNRLMVERGADTSFLKLHVTEIAKEIRQRLST